MLCRYYGIRKFFFFFEIVKFPQLDPGRRRYTTHFKQISKSDTAHFRLVDRLETLRVLDQLLSVFVDSGVGEKRRRLGAQVVVAVDILSQQRHLFDLNVVKFWLESN